MLRTERTDNSITIYKDEFIVNAKVVEGLLMVKAVKDEELTDIGDRRTGYDFSFDVSDQSVSVEDTDEYIRLVFGDK